MFLIILIEMVTISVLQEKGVELIGFQKLRFVGVTLLQLLTATYQIVCMSEPMFLLRHGALTVKDIQQLSNEAEYDVKNYADRGGCYPPTGIHDFLRDESNDLP